MSTEKTVAARSGAGRGLRPPWTRSRWLTGRGLLIGFTAVHLVFLIFAAVVSLQGNAFSDTNIYREWTRAGFDDAALAGGPSPWVYPVLALVPMALAGLVGSGPFFFMWVVIITALNGWAVWRLTDRGRNRRAIPAAWWWLAFTLLMGWLGFARVDGITAPIVLVALVYGVAHPFGASLLLSIATWMKVWPASIVLALFTVVRRRVRVVVAGVLVSAGAAGIAAAMGALPRLFDFLLQQGDRGMQLEATFTTPWLWSSVLGVGGSHMYMNTDINSMQVDGPGSEVMAALMQPLLLFATLAATALLIRALRRGERAGGADRTELLLAGALTLVSVFIVFNKVGSPQFMVWLGPAVALGLVHDRARWRTPALMLIGIAALTFLIYPLFYDALSHDNPVMALVLTLRNGLLVVLLWWSARRLYRLGSRRPPVRSAGEES